MKIVNIDAPEDLVEKVRDLEILPFILEVIKPLEEEYYHYAAAKIRFHFYRNNTSTVSLPTYPIRMYSKDVIGYKNIVTLIHTIPIYLRDKKPDIYDETGIIETLGAYYPSKNRFRVSPYIELFLTPISGSTKGNDIHFKWLFTKVLLHELAHAAMDIHNIEFSRKKKEKVTYKTTFGQWREESMANAVALNIIRYSHETGFYDYAKNFILNNEPDMYKLGVLLEEDFDKWDFRSLIRGKINGVHPDLQKEWLNFVKQECKTYFKGKPVNKDLKVWNEMLSNQFAYIFDKHLYTEEDELVFAIVNTVLTNYETANGRKMDYATFSSIFTNIKTGGGMSYKPSKNDEPNPTYPLKMNLNGVDYSLYHFWDHETLHQFVDKSGCKFDEYKNYEDSII